MNSMKRISALLMAVVLVFTLSACEIKRENNQENTTEGKSYEYREDETEGEDISDLLCTDGAGYQVWYADNGDIYAFNSAKQFYLKSNDTLYFGGYKFNTSGSSVYYAILSLMCDNDSSADKTFNVTMENGSFYLNNTSGSDDTVHITKGDVSSDVPEVPSDSDVPDESQGDSVASGNQAEDKPVYEIMGMNLYYVTFDSLSEGDNPSLTLNAAPASYVKSDDGTVNYTHDDANAVKMVVTEDTYVYMPSVDEPSSETYGCDLFQMKDCFDAMGGFYAIAIGDSNNLETVQYYYVGN